MYIYYIGQDGFKHRLGDNELKHYNHNHDPNTGRFAESNRITRTVASKYSSINKRQAKIDKLNEKIDSAKNKKRVYKAAKYKAKQAKISTRASKANRKLARGKELSNREMRSIERERKYQAKVAKYSYKNDRWNYQVSKLEYRNYRDARKINKMFDKYGPTSMRDVKASDRTRTVQKYLTEASTKKPTTKYVEYLEKKHDTDKKKK